MARRFLSRDFRLLWLGQATSQFGDRIHQLAMAWWVLQETGSAAMMGVLLALVSIPQVLFSPLAGPLVDRSERRKLMLLCDVLRAILVTVMAVLALRHALSIPLLFAMAFMLAVLGAVFMPASLSILPEVAEPDELMRANSLQQMTTQASGILGPALGGVLVAAFGAHLGFLGNAVTFLVSTLSLAMMSPSPIAPRAGGETYLESLKGGITTLKTRPAIATLLVAFAVCNIFLAPLSVLLPIFASQVFHRGAWGLGILEGALGLGMMVAAFTLAGASRVAAKVPFIGLSMGLQGFAMLAMGMFPSFYGFLPGLFLLGLALGALNIVAITTFQSAIPPEQLGRFMGLLSSVVIGIMPLSFAAAGLLASRFHAAALWIMSGIALAALGASLPFLPILGRLEKEIAAKSDAHAFQMVPSRE